MPGGARILAALYLGSGATGLCYEVLWSRMLIAQFGVSILGVATTVVAFLLGLGLGALLATRPRLRLAPTRSLQTFAALELAVALYALALPAINADLAPRLEALAPLLAAAQWHSLQALVSLLLLGLPAAAMGASFPMVLRAFAWSPALLGRVYGLNCLGAAAGALLSLALLAAWGWASAVQIVAALGASIAAAAALLARTAIWRAAPAAPVRIDAPRAAGGALGLRVWLSYAAVGACALMLEMAWTRLYALVMLRTEYVLALILAVYLLGTAIGSLLAARAQNLRRLATAVPLTACACTLAGLWALPHLSVWIQEQHFTSLTQALGVQALALGLCTLPTTAALGAWLPLLARTDGGGAPEDAVALYGANCLGAAGGAALTVLVAIPVVGTTASVALAAVLMLCLGLALGAPRALLLAVPLALGAAWALREFPAPQAMMPAQSDPGRQLFRYEDAVSLNHVTELPNGQRVLLTDLQHMDASSDPAAVQIQADQARLPLLLHPVPRSVLFLGLGTGISASGSLVYPRLQRTAVELSAGAVIAAQTWFAPVNGGVATRMDLVHDDARHYLAASTQHYAVIIGDLFHPDLAGMGNLLSVEQFARARARLEDEGIFVQWLALNQFDRETLHTVLRSFQRVFPDAVLFLDGMHLALVGSPHGRQRAGDVLHGHADLDAQQLDQASGGEGALTWLGRYWGPIAAGIGAVQREARPVIEFRLPQLRYQDDSPLAEILLEMLRRRPDADTACAQLGIAPEQRSGFLNAYLASELSVQSWIAALGADRDHARELTRLAYEANARDRWIASTLADELFAAAGHEADPAASRAALTQVLRVFPEHVEALRALWHLQRAQGDAQAEATLARLRAAAPLDREARAGVALAPERATNGN